jgi:hypothetical protein
VGVIQRQIEVCGIATTSISLVRRFTEAVRPPRALWVPFPFGRPLGAPRNVSAQHLVIREALELLSRSEGPVLEELILPPELEHLDAKHQTLGRSCGPNGCDLETILAAADSGQPVLVGPRPYDGDFTAVCQELVRLAGSHRRYYDLFGGRTQVGFSGVTPETIAEAANVVHRFVGGEKIVPHERGAAEPISEKQFIRLSIDDVKAFCLEARLAEDESAIENAAKANDWLWIDSRVGSLLAAARDRLIEVTDRTEDPNWILARGIVPRGYGRSGYGMTHVLEEE